MVGQSPRTRLSSGRIHRLRATVRALPDVDANEVFMVAPTSGGVCGGVRKLGSQLHLVQPTAGVGGQTAPTQIRRTKRASQSDTLLLRVDTGAIHRRESLDNIGGVVQHTDVWHLAVDRISPVGEASPPQLLLIPI